MSPRNERQRTCPSGKIRYPNKLGAKIAVASLERHGKGRRIYKCPDCFGWHLTSQTGH